MPPLPEFFSEHRCLGLMQQNTELSHSGLCTAVSASLTLRNHEVD